MSRLSQICLFLLIVFLAALGLELALTSPLQRRGGLGLVFQVDVDNAVQDRRDRLMTDIRAALAKQYGLSTADKPSREALDGLREKVQVDKPQNQPNILLVKFVDPADSAKLDESFMTKFADLERIESPEQPSVALRIKQDVQRQIQERAMTQARETLKRRLEAYGLNRTEVNAVETRLFVEVPSGSPQAIEGVKRLMTQIGRLEFKLVDDEADFFRPFAQATDVPNGLSIAIENAPVGPGKTNPIYFASMSRQQGEAMRETLERLKMWTSTLEVPDDRTIGFAKTFEYDPASDAQEDSGWRTYYLLADAELGGDRVQDAQAQEDKSADRRGAVYVAVDFTPAGAVLLEEMTASNIRRRIAIVLDGIVESAPVVLDKIAGGRASITMGSGDVNQQWLEGRRLAAVLRAGALPAPIALQSEMMVEPSTVVVTLDRALKGAILASVLMLIVLGVRNAMRRKPAKGEG